MFSRVFRQQERKLVFDVPRCSRHDLGMTKRTPAEVGAIIKARRLWLRMTPGELVRAADIDPKTLQRLEEGTRVPQARTRLALEPPLQWEPGSIDRIIDGDEPVPIANGAPRTFEPEQEARFLTAGYVQDLTDIWEAWRDIGMRLVEEKDAELSRQARRALLLSSGVVLNLLTIANPCPERDRLHQDVQTTMFKLFDHQHAVLGLPQQEGDQDAVPANPTPSAQPATPPAETSIEGEEAGDDDGGEEVGDEDQEPARPPATDHHPPSGDGPAPVDRARVGQRMRSKARKST